MSISILDNIKNSIINNSSQTIWDEIVAVYNDELMKVVVDGSTAEFLQILNDEGIDEVGLSAPQIAAIQADEAAGNWAIATGVSGGSYSNGALTLSASTGNLLITGFTSEDTNTNISGGSISSSGNLSLSGSQGVVNVNLSSLSGDTNITGGTAVASAGTLSLSGSQEIVALTGLAINIPSVIISQSAIYVHQNATNNATSNALTQNVTLPVDGNYILTLSFNYNVDSVNSDGVYYATFNGNALDLNDRSADPQGVNQILRIEAKDPASGPGGNITGTGVGQKYSYCMQFLLNSQTAGTYPLVIDVGSETGNVEASIWNVIARFDYLIQ